MFKFSGIGASYGVVILRVVLGVIFIAHGAPKVGSLETTIQQFQEIGIAPLATVAVSMTELLGGIALILGVLTRLAALGVSAVMLGAIIIVHGQHGFFLNWFMDPDKGHGYEYNLALLVMAVTLICSGAGRFSVDSVLARLQATRLKRHSFQEREKLT